MDAGFDEKVFTDACMDVFFQIQGAWANRDMSTAKNVLTDEMYGILSEDARKLKSEKKINRLDNIAVRSVDINEVWQESGAGLHHRQVSSQPAGLHDRRVDKTGPVGKPDGACEIRGVLDLHAPRREKRLEALGHSAGTVKK
jgi:hypothetical protein